ncbi:hypothetical protein ACB098_04G006600 [Castanea mollissima]
MQLKKYKGKKTQRGTNFCSTKTLVQATKFFVSRPIFPASPSKIYFCINPAVPHRNVFSLATSRIPNNSWADIGNLEDRIISCKDSDTSHPWNKEYGRSLQIKPERLKLISKKGCPVTKRAEPALK